MHSISRTEMDSTAKAQLADCQTKARDKSAFLALDQIIETLHNSDPRFSWTGIYIKQGAQLELATFRGPATPHAVISLDGGICGAAIREARTLNIPDVSKDSRYLSCDFRTKSEIVVPIFSSDGSAIAEIDIDSQELSAFSKNDAERLESLASELAPIVLQLIVR